MKNGLINLKTVFQTVLNLKADIRKSWSSRILGKNYQKLYFLPDTFLPHKIFDHTSKQIFEIQVCTRYH